MDISSLSPKNFKKAEHIFYGYIIGGSFVAFVIFYILMSQLSCYGIKEEEYKPPITIVKNKPCEDTFWVEVFIWVLLILVALGISFYSDLFTFIFPFLIVLYILRSYFNPFNYC